MRTWSLHPLPMYRVPSSGLRAFVFLALAGTLAGCAHGETRGDPPPAPVVEITPAPLPENLPRPDVVEGLLSYGLQLRGSDAAALEREYTRVSGRVMRQPNARNRVQLAMLLSLPGAAFQDTARARKQLEQVASENDDEVCPYRYFARYLLATLNDRRYFETALAEERRQRQELQQKLEQLKVIEQETGPRIQPKPMQEH